MLLHPKPAKRFERMHYHGMVAIPNELCPRSVLGRYHAHLFGLLPATSPAYNQAGIAWGIFWVQGVQIYTGQDIHQRDGPHSGVFFLFCQRAGRNSVPFTTITLAICLDLC